MDLQNQQLGDLLDSIAARKPSPGGGAVASVAAALAGALGQMVAAYSAPTSDPASDDSAIRDGMACLESGRRSALELAAEDARAYDEYSNLKKAIKESGGSKTDLVPTIRRIIDAPNRSISLSLEMLEACASMAPHANRWLLSDLAIAAEMAAAAARSSVWNLRVNTPLLAEALGAEGEDEATSMLERADREVERAQGMCEEISRMCLAHA